jgi:hypothetical protein
MTTGQEESRKGWNYLLANSAAMQTLCDWRDE